MEPEVKEPKSAPAPKKLVVATMRHPHTGHTVEATQEEIIPLMYRGYQQVKQ